ncbi:MAG: DNA polymerase IV [Actinocatenispora sp.]
MQSGEGPGGADGFGPDADDTGCPILHVDMDAFFAAVEVRDRPDLRGRPVIVGGIGPRGVVSSASYEARRFGVHSAMPTSRARRLCPGAVYLPPNFEQYTAASRAVMDIFRQITPLVEPLSLDEAFLDVAGAGRRLGPPAAIGRLIRARVVDELRLTCSVGVAPTKFVAKLASSRAKPDGLLVVPAGRVLEYLHRLPVSALWGVGERTAAQLHRLGLTTVADIAHSRPATLRATLGEAAGQHIYDLSQGLDPRQVTPRVAEKSVGAETTFDTDVADPDTIRRALLSLAGRCASRARRAGVVGRTITIKVRYADFRTINRSRTLPGTTDVAREMFETGWALFTALASDERIRLIGLRLEGLVTDGGAPRQLVLGEREHGWREAEQAVDAATARFGAAAVQPASLLRRDPTDRRSARPGDGSAGDHSRLNG